MKRLILGVICVLVLFASLLLSSCGRQEKHSDHDGHNHGSKDKGGEQVKETHEHDEGHEESEGVTYQEGKGIALPDETQRAMGVELSKVSEDYISPTINLTAQVYRSSLEASRFYGKERRGYAYATSLVSPGVAIQIPTNQKVIFSLKKESLTSYQGTVWKTISTQGPVLGKVEVIMELPDETGKFSVGEFIDVKIIIEGTSQKKVTIPQSAVLETSSGSFAFIEKEHFLQRTPLKLGVKSGDVIEVIEGLQIGDEIVTKAVESLYLIELRSTKGGGHAH